MRLEGKVALITGAASGMGASMARIFAREGAKVVVADQLDDEGKKVAAEIVAANGAASFHHLDVTNEANWKDVAAATVGEFGKLDILVNNAGISGSAVDDLYDTEAWDKIMGVNARGAFLGMKYAIPEMRKVGGGSIVNISSISGVTGQRGIHAAYNASKGAVRTMTKVGAVQHGRHNIRVNSVHPTNVNTPLFMNEGTMKLFRPDLENPGPEDLLPIGQLMHTLPVGWVEPVDISNAVLFLASDEARFITGVTLPIDAGSCLK